MPSLNANPSAAPVAMEASTARQKVRDGTGTSTPAVDTASHGTRVVTDGDTRNARSSVTWSGSDECRTSTV
jgi:uncharacterized protein YraI